jgi:hypothetical protein
LRVARRSLESQQITTTGQQHGRPGICPCSPPRLFNFYVPALRYCTVGYPPSHTHTCTHRAYGQRSSQQHRLPPVCASVLPTSRSPPTFNPSFIPNPSFHPPSTPLSLGLDRPSPVTPLILFCFAFFFFFPPLLSFIGSLAAIRLLHHQKTAVFLRPPLLRDRLRPAQPPPNAPVAIASSTFSVRFKVDDPSHPRGVPLSSAPDRIRANPPSFLLLTSTLCHRTARWPRHLSRKWTTRDL